MKTMKQRRILPVVACLAIQIAFALVVFPVQAQTVFATPELATDGLQKAVRMPDTTELRALFGPMGQEILSSGDSVADRWNREIVSVALGERCDLVKRDEDTRELIIGNEQWPFPIPLVRGPKGWYFDTEAGAVEVLVRRIGRNELSVIEACKTYIIAQNEYARTAHDGNPAGLYAQKFRSDVGKENGLFWETAPGEKSSPLGALFAEATAEGYEPARGSRPIPFRGYYFRILTAQGRKAKGGAMDYIVDGKMTRGFALIAFPAEYGNSGIMTFMVNQDGEVYERDLGPDTATIAAEVTVFNPTRQWSIIWR